MEVLGIAVFPFAGESYQFFGGDGEDEKVSRLNNTSVEH